MITIEEFSQAIQYKFTGGSPYQWNCFGSDARWLDSEEETYSASIVFDGNDQTVYIAEVCDYINNRAYRLIHPDYKSVHDDEAKERSVNTLQAWDNVDYIELEMSNDFIEKCSAIVSGLDYDTRVTVPFEIPDEDLFKYMIAAHERDITLNQFVEKALRAAIEDAERDPDGWKLRAKNFVEARKNQEIQ